MTCDVKTNRNKWFQLVIPQKGAPPTSFRPLVLEGLVCLSITEHLSRVPVWDASYWLDVVICRALSCRPSSKLFQIVPCQACHHFFSCPLCPLLPVFPWCVRLLGQCAVASYTTSTDTFASFSILCFLPSVLRSLPKTRGGFFPSLRANSEFGCWSAPCAGH